ncbi:hypothetical protein Tco_0777551 [Tanacetum coccineum]
MGHSSCSTTAEKMPKACLDLRRCPPNLPHSRSPNLLNWDDVLLLDRLLWLFSEERTLLLVLVVPKDRSDKPFVFELPEPSSSVTVVQAYWDAGLTDGTNVEANLRGRLGLVNGLRNLRLSGSAWLHRSLLICILAEIKKEHS